MMKLFAIILATCTLQVNAQSRLVYIFYKWHLGEKIRYTESVICDVIKIRLEMKDERTNGKGNP